MKKIILTLTLIAALGTASFAQCEKKSVLTSLKTEHVDAKGALIRSIDETAVVEMDKATLSISVNGNQIMSGPVKSKVCDWKTAFKDGKTVLKATVNDEQGGEKNVTLTIEGKDGKVTLLFEMEGMPDDKVKIVADKFEEKV